MKEKYWVIAHNPDITETGMLMQRTYMKTVWQGFPSQQYSEVDILTDFCFSRFGNKTAYIQGVAPCPNWRIDTSTREDFEKATPIMWGGLKTKTMQIELGIGDHGNVNLLSEIQRI